MEKIRHMSVPLFVPGKKGVRVSVSPARQTADAIKTPASPRKSITDAVRNESPTLFKDEDQSVSLQAPGLPIKMAPSPLNATEKSHELPKRLPKDRGSGGMDGQNNRSLDFFETDSSDEEQASSSHDVSPRSVATLDKSPSTSVSGSTRDKRQARNTVDATIPDTFDFGLDLPAQDIGDQKEKSRAEALASLDPRTFQNESTLSPIPSTARSVYGDTTPYQEMFEPFEDPRSLSQEDFAGALLDATQTENVQHPDVLDYTKHLLRGHEGDLDFQRLLMLHAVTSDKVLDISGRKTKRQRTPRTPESPNRPKSAGATPSSSPFRRTPGTEWEVPPLPKPLDLKAKPQSNTTDTRLPSGASKGAPLPTRPHGILRNPSWGPSVTSTKRRSMSSPEPPDQQTSRWPSAGARNGAIAPHQLSSIPKHLSFATERKASHISTKDSAPLTPYPQDAVETAQEAPAKHAPPKDVDQEQADVASHDTPAPPTPSARTPSVRIVEPRNQSITPKEAVNIARRTTSASRRRSSVINSAAVSADTILALSVRRRYGSNGRRFEHLVVPADEEIATPARSRRNSSASGRKMSIATTDPEMSQEGEDSENASPNQKAEFDDAAFFRELRKCYYGQLLGSTMVSRFYRRYLSAYVLKRITLVCSEGVVDPDPPNITPATRTTRLLTLRGFNEVQSEDSLIDHFLVPNIGRASWRWVRWVHRVAVSVDQDSAEFEARMRKHSFVPEQHISAVPGGLEFIEGPGVGRLMTAAAIVLVGSVLATVLYAGLGPTGAPGYTVEALTQGEFQVPHRDVADRLIQGILLGQFVLWFGAIVVVLWVLASALVT
ncbi:MAG: hypothetical protein Q9162_004881 [Coniocarpon cinnabarinum]